MHEARLSALAYRHAVKRKVIRIEESPSDVTLHLECGHTGHGVPHFDYRHTADWSCAACGVDYVRSAPQYAAEWRVPFVEPLDDNDGR